MHATNEHDNRKRGQGSPRPGISPMLEDGLRTIAQKLDAADAVVIGAGAGLSTAAGFTYAGPRFEQHFADFEAAYGFHDMYSGGFYPYATPNETWAFWSRYIMCNRYDTHENGTYAALLDLVRDKDYFVLTTNVDHQFQLAGFNKQRLFYTQGDYGLFQCSVPCHQKTYDNEDAVRAMAAAEQDMRVPDNLLPTCPVCGEPMAMNLRADDTFVEDEGWHASQDRYSRFVHAHEGQSVLYLELGVGYNTPVIIKYPFWQLTYRNPNATYACLNLEEQRFPTELDGRAISLGIDLHQGIDRLLQERGTL